MEVVRRLRSDLTESREGQPLGRHSIQIHPLKAGETQRPAIQGRYSVDSDSVQAMGARLIKRNHRGMRFDVVQQEVLVAGMGKLSLLLILGETRHVIDFVFLKADDIALRLRGKRGLGQKILPGTALGSFRFME